MCNRNTLNECDAIFLRVTHVLKRKKINMLTFKIINCPNKQQLHVFYLVCIHVGTIKRTHCLKWVNKCRSHVDLLLQFNLML